MLSAPNRLKQVVVLQWKTPKLLCNSSLLSTPRSYPSFDRAGSKFLRKKSISHLHNTKLIKSTPCKLPWIYPLYSILSTRSRSLVTKASIEEEEAAYQVFDEIVSNIKKNQHPIKELCTNHINDLCRRKKLQAAAKLLQLLRDKLAINSLPTYNLVLAAACENNATEIVSRIFKQILVNHLSLNSTTYSYVAKAISKSNDLTLVQSFVKEISDLINTESVTVVNRIIYAFADCGHVHNAMLVFDCMKSLKFKPDLVTYNTVLGILGKRGRTGEMLDMFASMKKADISPDIFTYNTLLHSLRKVGRFDLCVLLIDEMGQMGLKPDLVTYTALIECFLKSGNIEESLRLLEDMKRGDVRRSIYVYRSLISNLKRLGNSELALKFCEEMNECLEELVHPKDFKKSR